MWHIGAIVNMINKKLHKISLKISFLWQRFFLAKKLQKDSNIDLLNLI
jgi:hypothetical protein